MKAEITKREMAEAAFLRGETAFLKGRYQDTVVELSKCLSIEKSTDYQYLEADAYNTLGMLFFFSGYETTALDYYLSAYESAENNRNTDGLVSSLLNIGLLYQSCREYNKAMNYYRMARKTAEDDLKRQDMLLVLLSNIQIAGLLCRMECYEDALYMQKEIENYYLIAAGNEFLLTKCILDLYLEEYQGNTKRVGELLREIMRRLEQDERFVEKIDFYVDICDFMLENKKGVETRRMLDVLQEKLRPTDFLRLQVRLDEIEVHYQKLYGDEVSCRNACRHFMVLFREYEQSLNQFRRQNLENIKSLQRLEQKKREFEKRSKYDLTTGLLNKNAFMNEVEQHLMERSAQVTDAMAFIDIDDFKLANDSFGHAVGDEIIRTLAENIKESFGGNGICSRFGGDEFMVFIKDVKDMSLLESRIEEFRLKFAEEGFGTAGDLHLTISIGVSYNQRMKASFQALVSCADEALEKAKEYGKNRVTFYEIKRGINRYVEK